MQAARAGEVGAPSLANIAYGAAHCGTVKRSGALFTALARAAEKRVGEFVVQNIANTAWAFATADRLDASVFTALARAAEWRMCDFNAQGVANTAWAFVTADQLDASLFTALARAAEWRMSELF